MANYGLVNNHDVMLAAVCRVVMSSNDMSLNLSLDHVTNRSNDQYGAFRLPTLPSGGAANTERPGSPRDHLQPMRMFRQQIHLSINVYKQKLHAYNSPTS